MIKKIICFLFIIFGVCFGNDSSIKQNLDETVDIAFNHNKFFSYDKFVTNNLGEKIAYVVFKKPKNINYNSFNQLEFFIGSHINILDINSSEIITIKKGEKTSVVKPSWSNDSTKLAYYLIEDNTVELWIYDLTTNSSRKLTALNFSLNVFGGEPTWSHDDKFIYVFTNEENKGNNEFKGFPIKEFSNKTNEYNEKLFCENAYSKKAFKSFENDLVIKVEVNSGSSSIILPEDADHKIFSFQGSKSGKYLICNTNLIQQKDTMLYKIDIGAIDFDNNNKFSILSKDLVRNDFSLRILNSSDDKYFYIKDKKIHCVDLIAEATCQIAKHINADFVEFPFMLTSDEKNIIVGAKEDSRLKRQIDSIFVLSLDDSEHRRIILPENIAFHSLLTTNSFNAWQPEENSITILARNKDTKEINIIRYYWFDNNSKIQKKTLWKGSSTIENYFCSNLSNDFYCVYQDLLTPPNIYKFYDNFSKKVQLTNIEKKYENIHSPEAILIDTKVPIYDGSIVNVKTAILKPKGTSNKKIPAIVVLYPSAKASSLYNSFCGGDLTTIPNYVFLQQGYALIFPDMEIGPKNEKGNPIKEIVDCLLPQIYHASDLGLIDINNLGLIGQSWGGYAAAAIIAHTNLFRASVGISGIYDLCGNYGLIGDYYDWFHMRCTTSQLRIGQESPWENLQHYLNNSPYYIADKIKTPFLIIHGSADYCPVSGAEKMFTALSRLGKEVDLAIYKDEYHVLYSWKYDNAFDATKRVINFFDDHLKKENK